MHLVEALSARGVSAASFDTVDGIVVHLVEEHSEGDVVLVMSNGSFGNIWERLLEALRSVGARSV